MEDYGLKALLGSMLHRGIGHGNPSSRAPYKPIERLTAAFEMTRPLLAVMGTALVAAGAVLALGPLPPLIMIIYGITCSALANFYIHTFNDWSDRERDREAWPKRALPSSRISARAALLLSLFYFILAIVLTWIFFNITTAVILTISLSLGTIYTKYLRDRVGYLTLPFIIGIHPVGGWAAFSAHTLFKNPLPWILYVLVRKGKRVTQVRAFFFWTTPHQAAVLGFFFLLLTFCVSIYLFFVTPLGYFYLCIAILSAVYALIPSALLIKDPENKKKALNAFNVASLYALILCLSILIDILVFHVLGTHILSILSSLYAIPSLWLLPLLFAGFATLIGLFFVGIFILDRIIKIVMKRKRYIFNNR
jgi:4-hydroxybenzoate polyprenyltransferase